MYKVNIDGVAELTEEVQKVEFSSETPVDSGARSSSIVATMTITGRVAYDSDKVFMKEATGKIAEWSMKKPDSPETYKSVTVNFDHTGVSRSYSLENAFVVSFRESFEDQNGYFELVVRQKKDRLDGVTVE